MNDWTPSNLFHCLDSPALAWLNIFLSAGVVVWYVIITCTTWIPAMRGSPKAGARAMFWMAVIFVFCSLAGYATLALAGFFPKTAFIVRTVALALQNIACPVFLFSKYNQDFKSIGRQGPIKLDPALVSKSDAELAALVRAAVKGQEQ